MAFEEKSAWIMAAALLIGGAIYFGLIYGGGAGLTSPSVPTVAVYTIVLLAVAVAGHIVLLAIKPGEADSPPDERDRGIFERAGHISGYVFGAGIVLSLGLYLLDSDGDLLFYLVFASLMIAQFSECALRIFFYRAGL